LVGSDCPSLGAPGEAALAPVDGETGARAANIIVRKAAQVQVGRDLISGAWSGPAWRGTGDYSISPAGEQRRERAQVCGTILRGTWERGRPARFGRGASPSRLPTAWGLLCEAGPAPGWQWAPYYVREVG